MLGEVVDAAPEGDVGDLRLAPAKLVLDVLVEQVELGEDGVGASYNFV